MGRIFATDFSPCRPASVRFVVAAVEKNPCFNSKTVNLSPDWEDFILAFGEKLEMGWMF